MSDYIISQNVSSYITPTYYIPGKEGINYVNIEDSLIEARYLISKDYVLDEKILEEKIIFNDEDNKKMILHYKCEEILNSF